MRVILSSLTWKKSQISLVLLKMTLKELWLQYNLFKGGDSSLIHAYHISERKTT